VSAVIPELLVVARRLELRGLRVVDPLAGMNRTGRNGLSHLVGAELLAVEGHAQKDLARGDLVRVEHALQDCVDVEVVLVDEIGRGVEVRVVGRALRPRAGQVVGHQVDEVDALRDFLPAHVLQRVRSRADRGGDDPLRKARAKRDHELGERLLVRLDLRIFELVTDERFPVDVDAVVAVRGDDLIEVVEELRPRLGVARHLVPGPVELAPGPAADRGEELDAVLLGELRQLGIEDPAVGHRAVLLEQEEAPRDVGELRIIVVGGRPLRVVAGVGISEDDLVRTGPNLGGSRRRRGRSRGTSRSLLLEPAGAERENDYDQPQYVEFIGLHRCTPVLSKVFPDHRFVNRSRCSWCATSRPACLVRNREAESWRSCRAPPAAP